MLFRFKCWCILMKLAKYWFFGEDLFAMLLHICWLNVIFLIKADLISFIASLAKCFDISKFKYIIFNCIYCFKLFIKVLKNSFLEWCKNFGFFRRHKEAWEMVIDKQNGAEEVKGINGYQVLFNYYFNSYLLWFKAWYMRHLIQITTK